MFFLAAARCFSVAISSLVQSFFLLAYFSSFFSLIPVFVFLPSRLRCSSAPMNLRCFSVLAGTLDLLLHKVGFWAKRFHASPIARNDSQAGRCCSRGESGWTRARHRGGARLPRLASIWRSANVR